MQCSLPGAVFLLPVLPDFIILQRSILQKQHQVIRTKHNTQAASGARSLINVGAYTNVWSDAATVAAVCLCERKTQQPLQHCKDASENNIYNRL